jgi:hypothetical protein
VRSRDALWTLGSKIIIKSSVLVHLCHAWALFHVSRVLSIQIGRHWDFLNCGWRSFSWACVHWSHNVFNLSIWGRNWWHTLNLLHFWQINPINDLKIRRLFCESSSTHWAFRHSLVTWGRQWWVYTSCIVWSISISRVFSLIFLDFASTWTISGIILTLLNCSFP